jgi:hypothetical protein
MTADIIGKLNTQRKYLRTVLRVKALKYTGLLDIKDLQKNPDPK